MQVKAIFTDNITDKIINFSNNNRYDIKLLKPVDSKYHQSFSKHLNYRDFLNYKNVVVVTDDKLLDEKVINFTNEDSIGVLRSNVSYTYSNVNIFIKAINKEFVNDTSINTDIIIYNNISQFVALFHRIEQFCKFVDKPFMYTLNSNKVKTPNFLNSELEKDLFSYFCADMYKDFKLRFL
jgi:hypothetical protein